MDQNCDRSSSRSVAVDSSKSSIESVARLAASSPCAGPDQTDKSSSLLYENASSVALRGIHGMQSHQVKANKTDCTSDNQNAGRSIILPPVLLAEYQEE